MKFSERLKIKKRGCHVCLYSRSYTEELTILFQFRVTSLYRRFVNVGWLRCLEEDASVPHAHTSKLQFSALPNFRSWVRFLRFVLLS